MNLVGSTWIIWNLIPIDFHSWHHYASLYRSTSWDSGHGISFWQPETKVVTSRKLWNSCHGGRFSVLSFVNTRDARQCLCSFVSVYFICGFAKCLLCFQLPNNIWTFSVFFCIFVVSVASVNNCWKVICGSRLARHVIDDANRGCRAKITWQTRNKTNLPEEPKEAKQNTKDIWMSSETKVQKHAKSEIWDLGFKKTHYEYDIALSNKVSVPLKLYWMLLSNSAMG